MKPEKAKTKLRDASTEGEQLPESLKKSQLLRLVRELQNVRDNPRLMVFITHGVIELLVNALIDAKCKNARQMGQAQNDVPYSARLVMIHELGLINDFRFKSLHWFQRLRSDAAHKQQFDVTEGEIRDQLQQVTDTIIIGEDGKPAFSIASLQQLCLMLIVTLWTDHSDIFSPLFVPLDPTKPAPAPPPKWPQHPSSKRL